MKCTFINETSFDPASPANAFFVWKRPLSDYNVNDPLLDGVYDPLVAQMQSPYDAANDGTHGFYYLWGEWGPRDQPPNGRARPRAPAGTLPAGADSDTPTIKVVHSVGFA